VVPWPSSAEPAERVQADATGPGDREREPDRPRPEPGPHPWSRRVRRREVVAVTVLLVCFGVVTADVLLGGPLRAADHQIDRWVVAYVPEPVVMLFRRWLVLPGQRLVDVPPMAVAAGVLAWRRRQWRPLLVPLAVMVLLALVVPGLKLWTGRTNPISGHDWLWAGGTEYPSGHEINSIVVWGMFFAMAGQLSWPVGRWLTHRRQVALTTAMAVWVACGVMIARTHWFSDVVASWCIAIPLLWGTLRFGFVKPPRPSPPVVEERTE
jgi:undecaprenyl-diphosphatase